MDKNISITDAIMVTDFLYNIFKSKSIKVPTTTRANNSIVWENYHECFNWLKEKLLESDKISDSILPDTTADETTTLTNRLHESQFDPSLTILLKAEYCEFFDKVLPYARDFFDSKKDNNDHKEKYTDMRNIVNYQYKVTSFYDILVSLPIASIFFSVLTGLSATALHLLRFDFGRAILFKVPPTGTTTWMIVFGFITVLCGILVIASVASLAVNLRKLTPSYPKKLKKEVDKDFSTLLENLRSCGSEPTKDTHSKTLSSDKLLLPNASSTPSYNKLKRSANTPMNLDELS